MNLTLGNKTFGMKNAKNKKKKNQLRSLAVWELESSVFLFCFLAEFLLEGID